jgi:hypothetical protein
LKNKGPSTISFRSQQVCGDLGRLALPVLGATFLVWVAWCKKTQVKSQVLGAKTQVESLVLGRFAVLG